LYISSLRLKNFRNYEEAELRFSRHANLVLGENGRGKTNLLEAIFLLSSSKSFRHISDSRLARRGEKGYTILGEFCTEGGDALSIALEYSPSSKALMINGAREARISSIVGVVYIVLLSFEDITLVTGPPFGRRGFMDLMLSTVDPLYFSTLKTYLQSVKQKNSYLGETAHPDDVMMGAWNEQISASGSYLIGRRMELIGYFNRFMKEHSEVMPQFSAPLNLEYRSTVADIPKGVADIPKGVADIPKGVADIPRGAAVEEIRERFNEQLISRMETEFRLRHAAYGPHRDDFRFLDNQSEIRYFGSIGEARLASILLKLAQVSYYRTQRGVRPIVLVDDILLELDSGNRTRVLSLFDEEDQLIVATTENERMPEAFSPDRVFMIHRGGNITWDDT
jgi:DNA replication and repair protein RecF